MQVEELYNWLRVASILSIGQFFEIQVQASLSFISVSFIHKDSLSGEGWQILEPHLLQILLQLHECIIALADGIRYLAWLVH